jgi:hypothetical protein
MTGRARNLFKKIVSENPKGTFDTEAVAILRLLCEAEYQHYNATLMLRKEGTLVDTVVGWNKVTGEPYTKKARSAWFNVQRDASTTVASMSAKLRAKLMVHGLVKPLRGEHRPGRVMFE